MPEYTYTVTQTTHYYRGVDLDKPEDITELFENGEWDDGKNEVKDERIQVFEAETGKLVWDSHAEDKPGHDLLITVTRSAGDDRAVLVFVDTPNVGVHDDPGLRILVNDDEAFVGKAYDFGANHEAESVQFEVRLDDIGYTGRELA